MGYCMKERRKTRHRLRYSQAHGPNQADSNELHTMQNEPMARSGAGVSSSRRRMTTPVYISSCSTSTPAHIYSSNVRDKKH